MKTHYLLLYVLISMLMTTGCQWTSKPAAPELTFHNECLSPLPAPPRNQGQAESCWGYSMTARLENRLMLCGDTIALSPWFITRKAYEEAALRAWQDKARKVSIRGMGHTFLSLAGRYGIVPQDEYPCRPRTRLKDMNRELADLLKKHRKDTDSGKQFLQEVNAILDRYMGTLPERVGRDSLSLSPLEYYHRLTAGMPDVKRLTSFQYTPYNQELVLDYPDNYERKSFMNLPLDSLCRIAEQTVKKGGTVVWEGDTSNNGFYWREGLAIWHDAPVSPDDRENNYRRGHLDDNHTLLLVGWATDNEGRPYFVAQNSWGTNNRYHGLMYMSLDYFRMWTVALFL